MKKEDLHIGDSVTAKVKEDLDHPFTGTIQKLYENSLLLAITDYAPSDKSNVTELNFKIVINFKSVTKNVTTGKKSTGKRGKKAAAPVNPEKSGSVVIEHAAAPKPAFKAQAKPEPKKSAED